MSCRKYHAPRHGSLAYCPKRRTKTLKQSISTVSPRIRSEVNLIGFLAYKCGMTHTVTVSERISRIERKRDQKREIVNAVTILEAPPMQCFGIVGYKKEVGGFKNIGTMYSEQIPENVKRRLLKNPSKTKIVPFSRKREQSEEFLKKSDVLKLIVAATPPKALNTKKAHISEMQVTGKNRKAVVDFCLEKLGKEIRVSDVFAENELIDTIGTTKGKGFNGVVKRFGVRIQPRKSRKGRRKVACIGAWHPANVMRTVARAGQLGYFRRTEFNKKIYKLGNGQETFQTDFDLTEKKITPMGGFARFGEVTSDYLMVKGAVVGCPKRIVTLRKSLRPSYKKKHNENVVLKFVDTSSKFGRGRFQTTEEKRRFFGPLKGELENQN